MVAILYWLRLRLGKMLQPGGFYMDSGALPMGAAAARCG